MAISTSQQPQTYSRTNSRLVTQKKKKGKGALVVSQSPDFYLWRALKLSPSEWPSFGFKGNFMGGMSQNQTKWCKNRITSYHRCLEAVIASNGFAATFYNVGHLWYPPPAYVCMFMSVYAYVCVCVRNHFYRAHADVSQLNWFGCDFAR